MPCRFGNCAIPEKRKQGYTYPKARTGLYVVLVVAGTGLFLHWLARIGQ